MTAATGVRLRTEMVPDDGLLLAHGQVEATRLVRFPDGALTYVLNPPARRSWDQHGALAGAREVAWSLADSADGTVLSAAEHEAEVDLLDLSGEAVPEFAEDRPEPLTTLPAFEPLGGVRELGRYLVGGRVVTGTPTVKKLIDTTSLSLYRTARLRGGPLWDGVAAYVAESMAARVENAPSGLVHDIWGGGETHVRYINDALLLLTAHAEWTADERFARAADRVCGFLDDFTVELGGGRWILHDSLERDAARHNLVLNTHLQAIVALMSAGRDVSAKLIAAEEALAPRVGGLSGLWASAAIVLLETARARGLRGVVRRLAAPTYERTGELCADSRALRLPGGWIARHASGRPTPGRYLTVNLGDLASLLASMPAPSPTLRRYLDYGLRFARCSGFFRAELRERTHMSILTPVVLRLAGDGARARAWAEATRAAGLAPLVGWPGYEDRLWARLGDGAPL